MLYSEAGIPKANLFFLLLKLFQSIFDLFVITHPEFEARVNICCPITVRKQVFLCKGGSEKIKKQYQARQFLYNFAQTHYVQLVSSSLRLSSSIIRTVQMLRIDSE